VAGGIEVPQELHCFQERGRARRLQGHGEVGEQAGRKLAEVTTKRKPPALPGDSQSLTVPGIGVKNSLW
jgi:hypothetical protein